MTSQIDAGRNAAIGLKDYLDGLAAVLRVQPEAWVRCELLVLNAGSKFVSMEFVEQDGSGKQQASVKGGCWPDALERIQQAFADNGLRLEAGQRVMVKLRANLQAAYGFKVDVLDVDPAYALGDLKVRMEAIRTRLRQADLWERNRSLPKPRDFVRVAVISPAAAAGLGDFRSTASKLEARGLVAFKYLEAPFQTEAAPSTIVGALRSIYQECKTGRFCAVAIIRGGGASGDLAWLVDYDLIRAICLMPVPVITGIGHQRDDTLLDEVACIRCDTPSKVAEHIKATVTAAGMQAGQAVRDTLAQAGSDLANLETAVWRAEREIEVNVTSAMRTWDASVRTSMDVLRPDSRRLLDRASVLTGAVVQAICSTARSRRDQARADVSEAVHMTRSGAEGRLKLAEAGVRTFTQDARGAPLTAADAAGRAVDRVSRDIASSAGAALLAAERSVATMDRDIRSAPSRAVAVAADGLNVVAGNFAAAARAALQSAEMAVTLSNQAALAAPVRTLDAVSAETRMVALGIIAAAAAALRSIPLVETQRSALQGARSSLSECGAETARVRALAEAVDPAMTIAAGYAILRAPDGTPLTSIAAAAAMPRIQAELRDGSIALATMGKEVGL